MRKRSIVSVTAKERASMLVVRVHPDDKRLLRLRTPPVMEPDEERSSNRNNKMHTLRKGTDTY